jgi:hypothetical protein
MTARGEPHRITLDCGRRLDGAENGTHASGFKLIQDKSDFDASPRAPIRRAS